MPCRRPSTLGSALPPSPDSGQRRGVASIDDCFRPAGRVTRKRGYFLLMGLCLTLIVLAWTVVRTVSTTWAVIMSAAALLLPPIAAMVANAGDEQRPRR